MRVATVPISVTQLVSELASLDSNKMSAGRGFDEGEGTLEAATEEYNFEF